MVSRTEVSIAASPRRLRMDQQDSGGRSGVISPGLGKQADASTHQATRGHTVQGDVSKTASEPGASSLLDFGTCVTRADLVARQKSLSLI